MLCFYSGCSRTDSGNTNGLVGFISDWGEYDSLVGEAKGAMYSVDRDIEIVDITHMIPLQNIREASIFLHLAAQHFPGGSTFLVTILPGTPSLDTVKPIILQTEDHKFFVAPDNGVLSQVLEKMDILKAYEIDTESITNEELKIVFIGRDLYAPVAAHLAAGTDPEELGAEISVDELTNFSGMKNALNGDRATGQVEFITDGGHIIADITRNTFDQLGIAQGDYIYIEIEGRELKALVAESYSDVPRGEWLCFFWNDELLEVAQNYGRANDFFEAEGGQPITIRLAE
jgi:S-adenosyl-L-methionine hydrolase (adenosine-forming)